MNRERGLDEDSKKARAQKGTDRSGLVRVIKSYKAEVSSVSPTFIEDH